MTDCQQHDNQLRCMSSLFKSLNKIILSPAAVTSIEVISGIFYDSVDFWWNLAQKAFQRDCYAVGY